MGYIALIENKTCINASFFENDFVGCFVSWLVGWLVSFGWLVFMSYQPLNVL